MKIVTFFGIVLSFFVLMTPPAQALDKENRIRIKGEILDGAFKGTTFKGYCDRDPLGGRLKQINQCVIHTGDGYKIVDPQASIEIIGGRAIRIILGPTISTTDRKGNFKSSVFEATTVYDEEINLFDALPERFVSVISA